MSLTLQGAVAYAIGKGYTINYDDNPTIQINQVEFYGASPGEIRKAMEKHQDERGSVHYHALKIALRKLAIDKAWPIAFPGYKPSAFNYIKRSQNQLW